MSELRFLKLQGEAETFDCGNKSVNDLILKSYYPTILQHAYTYQVLSDKKVLGYYMLEFKNHRLDVCPDIISDYQSTLKSSCTSIHIRYIGIATEYQGVGIGTAVLAYIVSNVKVLCSKWPVRFITLDALKEKYEWYKKRGFLAYGERELASNLETIPMYMDCILGADRVENYVHNLSSII